MEKQKFHLFGKVLPVVMMEKELNCQKAGRFNKVSKGECIAEKLIPFKNELAVIVARNASGEMKTYPVVEMEFHPEANQVEYVICPARIDDEVAKKARKLP